MAIPNEERILDHLHDTVMLLHKALGGEGQMPDMTEEILPRLKYIRDDLGSMRALKDKTRNATNIAQNETEKKKRPTSEGLSDARFEELEAIIGNWKSCSTLTDWEVGFMEDMEERFSQYGKRTKVSPRQWEVLDRIGEKVI